MRLLCDTQIILWALYEARRLRPEAAELVTDRDNEVLFSAVSLWEIALKGRTGKLDAVVEEVDRSYRGIGMTYLAIEVPHLAALTKMTDVLHKDPFDHLLIAQAMAEGASFLTADRIVQRYPIDIIKA